MADDVPPVPIRFELRQNYPNPFNGETIINYAIPEAVFVRLEVFNILGQRVSVLVNGQLEAGFHSITWHSGGMPSGVYFYSLYAGGRSDIKRMLLVK